MHYGMKSIGPMHELVMNSSNKTAGNTAYLGGGGEGGPAAIPSSEYVVHACGFTSTQSVHQCTLCMALCSFVAF